MDTDSFLMCFQRFTSSRRHPLAVFGGNGTNFVEAELELREAVTKFNWCWWPLPIIHETSNSNGQEPDWIFLQYEGVHGIPKENIFNYDETTCRATQERINVFNLFSNILFIMENGTS